MGLSPLSLQAYLKKNAFIKNQQCINNNTDKCIFKKLPCAHVKKGNDFINDSDNKSICVEPNRYHKIPKKADICILSAIKVETFFPFLSEYPKNP